MKKLTSVAIATAVSIGTLGLAASPAFAATDAPACVARTVFNNDSNTRPFSVKLKNNCDSAKNVKIIASRGSDSQCIGLAVGQEKSFSSQSVLAKYDKLVLC